MSKLINLFVGFVILVLSIGVKANPTYTQIGSVSILGENYDVSLLSDTSYDAQSFNELSPSITFTTADDANAAVLALIATFGDLYDWNPTCSLCDDVFRVPFAFGNTNYSYMIGDANVNPGGGHGGPFTVGRDDDNYGSFAQFLAIPSSVAEPESIALLAIGLMVLSLNRSKKQQRYETTICAL